MIPNAAAATVTKVIQMQPATEAPSQDFLTAKIICKITSPGATIIIEQNARIANKIVNAIASNVPIIIRASSKTPTTKQIAKYTKNKGITKIIDKSPTAPKLDSTTPIPPVKTVTVK